MHFNTQKNKNKTQLYYTIIMQKKGKTQQIAVYSVF